MTPDQLERAARHYCKLMGLDAEEPLPLGPKWQYIAKEIRIHWAMTEALREGMRDNRWDAEREAIRKIVEQRD